MTEGIDFEADAEALVSSDDSLSAIGVLVQRQMDLEADVADLERQLKDKKAELRKIQERDLPEAMDAANTSEHKTKDGVKVTVKEDLTLSLTGGKKDFAFNWLEEIGSGDMITHEVVIPFGKGKDNERGDLVADLEQKGIGFSDIKNVNTGSLKALLRKRLENGEEVPLDELGGYQWKKAVITV